MSFSSFSLSDFRFKRFKLYQACEDLILRVSRGCLFSALSPYTYTMSGQLARQTPILRTNTLSRTSLSQRVRATAPWRLVITAIISQRSHLAQLIQNVFIRDTLSLSREQAPPVSPHLRDPALFRYNCFVYRPQSERPILAYTQTMSFSTLFYISHWSTLRSLSFTALFSPFAFFLSDLLIKLESTLMSFRSKIRYFYKNCQNYFSYQISRKHYI